MITIFFSEDGYCVAGGGMKISRACSPATSDGKRIFPPLHHEYKVLFLALNEIRDLKNEDVMVYGSSRIIDEINGVAEPLDEVCQRWTRLIRQSLIPSIKPLVFFRKKSSTEVDQVLSDLLPKQNSKILFDMLESEQAKRRKGNLDRKKRIINNLFNNWIGENHDNREKQ